MVGNDVVDLCCADTQAGATHPRFDARVFAPQERAALAASLEPNRLRWILWAGKESAFKLARRRDPSTIFSPRQFVVSLHDAAGGTVCYRDEAFALSISVGAAAVHTIATPIAGSALRLCAAVADVGAEDPSIAARRLAIAELASCLGMPSGDLAIVRERRVPRLQRRGQPLPFALSLSHHGRFVAFACAVPADGESRRRTTWDDESVLRGRR